MQKLRSLRVQKFNAITKCLGILLETKLLNLSIYGHSIARVAFNHFSHDPIKNRAIILEGLARIQEIVDLYKMDREALLHLKSDQDLETIDLLEKMQLKSPVSKSEVMRASEAELKELEDSVANGLTRFDIVNDTKVLFSLLYDSDDYYDKKDHTVEQAIDKYLSKVEKKFGNAKEWSNVTSDTHLLLLWFNRFRPAA